MDRCHQHTTMEGPWDIERTSVLLSTYMDRNLTGTQDIVDNARKTRLIEEYIGKHNCNACGSNTFYCGSKSEGIFMRGSDIDIMNINHTVVVLYPGQSGPPDSTHKTVLYMKETDCRPGYVALQLGQLGHIVHICLYHSLVQVGDAMFVSSDMYREQVVDQLTKLTGTQHVSNGPSSTSQDIDTVRCFHCKSWPREANEWVTRTRFYGWPSQMLIDKIVQNGCHLVPVGDKCSEDTFLQWRISFASAERSLVHSFSHLQMKIYYLLKYFLKQIQVTLRDIIGKEDDDILCSYFLKTVMFTSVETSHPKLWQQEQNLFYCFWFCFNILISCVRTGHFPNYFIPTINMFQRKVHGQNQQKLFHILNNFHTQKLLCLSHETFFNVNLLECVCNVEMQTRLMCPQSVQEMECRHGMTIKYLLETPLSYACHSMKALTRAMHLLMKSSSEADEAITFVYMVDLVSIIAMKQFYKVDQIAGPINNKTRYQALRKCKHRLTLCASTGTHLLNLATLHFLTGNYCKSLEMCRHITSQPSYKACCYTCMLAGGQKQKEMYTQQYCGKGYTLIHKLKKTLAKPIVLGNEIMSLSHFHYEMSIDKLYRRIPPLPYAVFLTFLCCHELGDTGGCDEVLRNLIVVKYDKYHGASKDWFVHTLLGICYETLGDYRRAIRAYWDSAQTKTLGHEINPALARIAALYRDMTMGETVIGRM